MRAELSLQTAPDTLGWLLFWTDEWNELVAGDDSLSDEQLAAVPAWHRARYEAMDKYVEVLGAEDPVQFQGLTAAQSQARRSAA